VVVSKKIFVTNILLIGDTGDNLVLSGDQAIVESEKSLVRS